MGIIKEDNSEDCMAMLDMIAENHFLLRGDKLQWEKPMLEVDDRLNSESSDMDILNYLLLRLSNCIDTRLRVFENGYILNEERPESFRKIYAPSDIKIVIDSTFNRFCLTLLDACRKLSSSCSIDDYVISIHQTNISCCITRDPNKLTLTIGNYDINYGYMNIITTGFGKGYEPKFVDVIRDLSIKVLSGRDPIDLYYVTCLKNCFNDKLIHEKNCDSLLNDVNWSNSLINIDNLIRYCEDYTTISSIALAQVSIELPKLCDAFYDFSNFLDCYLREYDNHISFGTAKINRLQRIFIDINKDKKIVLATDAAATYNSLLKGLPIAHQYFDVNTQSKNIDDVIVYPIHYIDDKMYDTDFCTLVDGVYIPNCERVILSFINTHEKGYEEYLIEVMQEYLHDNNDDLSKLYEVADHYNIHRATINYWAKEAREESDL